MSSATWCASEGQGISDHRNQSFRIIDADHRIIHYFDIRLNLLAAIACLNSFRQVIEGFLFQVFKFVNLCFDWTSEQVCQPAIYGVSRSFILPNKRDLTTTAQQAQSRLTPCVCLTLRAGEFHAIGSVWFCGAALPFALGFVFAVVFSCRR